MTGPGDEDTWAQRKEWEEERQLESSGDEEQSRDEARAEADEAKYDTWRDSQ